MPASARLAHAADLFAIWSQFIQYTPLVLRHHLLHHAVDAEAGRAGTRREFLEALQPLGEQRRRRVQQVVLLHEPIYVLEALLAALEGVGAQIEELGDAHLRQRFAPHFEPLAPLLGEVHFVPPHPDSHALAVVAPVDEALTRRLVRLAGEERQQVHAVEVNLVGLAAHGKALLHFLDEIRLAVRRGERGDEVLQRGDVVDDATGLDHSGPAHDARYPPATFPVGVLLAAERRRAAIGPGQDFGTVVRREDDD